jgi:alkylation response protein AidB-like acyl-CoA dehydrogenase
LDFAWSDEQLAFRKEVIRFAREELNDDMIQRDQEEEFFWEGWKKCAKFGIQGLPVPLEFGGGGADALTAVCALEALGYGCRDNGLLFALNAHMWGAEVPILSFGTEPQRKRYLPKLISGDWVGVHAMTEPAASGSGGHVLQTRALRRGNGYVLNGCKTFIANAADADLVVVYTSLDAPSGSDAVTAFIVEKGTSGFTLTCKLRQMGLRTSPMAELSFTDCEIPAENLLGTEGSGLAIFAACAEWQRICVLASYLGTMQRLLETSVEYARERKQFGQAIGKFAAVADKIADMEVRLESGRLLLYKAAWLKSQGKDSTREASIANLYLGEASIQSCMDAMQIHGGYGYMTEYQLERELRDAISAKTYSGTSNVQRMNIAGLHGL